MKSKITFFKEFFIYMSKNSIFSQRRKYLTSDVSNFQKDYCNIANDGKTISDDFKKVIIKNKKLFYGQSNQC